MKDKNKQGDHLKLVLADTFVLYMKTYAVHWNYKGAKFFSVHKLTELQYEELALAIDEIAERIRARDDEAPISLSNILASADLKELHVHEASNDSAIKDLCESHNLLSQRAKEAAEHYNQVGDLFSMDMMVKRIGSHDKAFWMLKSFLKGSMEASLPHVPYEERQKGADTH